jgi:glycosyltransferase involved in cell wall biosynthesis
MLEEYGVVVPAFNAADRLAAVLEGVKKHIPPDRIVVVDDGSTDDTSRIAESAGVLIVRHHENRGKGSALKSGFDHLMKGGGLAAIFTIDADGQHAPEEIPAFARAYRAGEGEILIGNRMKNTKGMPPLRVVVNMVTSALISIRAGCRIEDSQSGYRLIGTDVIRAVRLVTSRYETESEILIKAARIGARISSVPIRTIYAGEKSKIHPFADTVRFFALVIRSFFW